MSIVINPKGREVVVEDFRLPELLKKGYKEVVKNKPEEPKEIKKFKRAISK